MSFLSCKFSGKDYNLSQLDLTDDVPVILTEKDFLAAAYAIDRGMQDYHKTFGRVEVSAEAKVSPRL